MLGGSVYIAFIRFAISLAGVILLFSQISESRFPRKKTILCYGSFCLVVTVMACIWYALYWENCVRMVAFTMYICFAVFSLWISRDSFYLAVYKLALVFYLMAVFVIGGLEISILLFDRNVWADIIARLLLIGLLALLIDRYVQKAIQGFGDYIEKEADKFSVAIMIICILLGIGYILNPGLNREMTPARIYQLLTNFILTGTLQLLIFHFYCHVGNEKEYERENQIIQMNYRLLERQMEILEESVESGRRIRHDARHHNAVIAEYVRRDQKEELLHYLKEYEKEIDSGIPEMICANAAVNNILSAYTRKARSEGIEVTLDVEIGKNLEIPSIDLIAILANAYENAIYACMEVKKHLDERKCFIHLMLRKRKNKLVISCSNTCRMETELKDGQPKTEFTGGVGVSSIIRAAEKYGGEYDFKNDNGVFVFRLVMNAEQAEQNADTSDGR
ncbi:MAG: GHKL domain-containing protein [Clostridium sp.]|nr:GHKL domain-containing protein [Clostridium sp.]